MKYLFYTLLLVFSYSYSYAGSKDIQKIIEKYYTEGKLNGAILVAKDGRVLCDTAVGWANKELNFKATTETQFYAASITKTFTAVAIAQLVNQGKMRYQDFITKYIPSLNSFAQEITIHQLLTHTSGIPDYETEMPILGVNNNEKVLEWLNKENRLNFISGTQHKYCNSGFILLAKAIEEVSGLSYEAYLQQYVFKPSGMNRTDLYKGEEQKGKQVAVGYDKTGKKDDFDLTTYGDTGLLTTIRDLYCYSNSLTKSEVLPIEQKGVMYTPVELSNGKTANYGYGWRVEKQNKHDVVYHKGGLNGFKSILWRDLTDDTIIVILTNYGDLLPTDALVKELYQAVQM
ncbi:MAG: beta-lactamase family protein [Flavobacteriaceae bacterium]|jgi:CubicO group peptidase (beta-lactamase class C family)|nr:beta-lactamase family protein [Flavobacteriaceae bacterium]